MKTGQILIGILCLGVVVLLGSAFRDRAQLESRQTYAPTSMRASYDLTRQVVMENNAMGLRLFQELHRAAPDQNLLISPTSISMAFSMLRNGTTGATEQELRDFLGLGDLTAEQWNLAQSTLANPSTGTLKVANSLWHMQGIPLVENFNRVSQEYYGAQVAGVPFGKPEAARRINNWVKDATRGLIPQIVDGTEPLDRLVLVNALYLKAEWVRPFDKSATSQQPFHLPGGRQVQVPLLSQVGIYNYWEDDSVQAIRLPFKEGGMGVVAILPSEAMVFEDWIANLSAADLTAIRASMQEREGHVRIPKLDYGSHYSLVEPLEALGLTAPFQFSRDFAALVQTPERVRVSQVQHKTRLKLHEEGVEAAAVTAILASGSGIPRPSERFSLIFDRPFLLLIEDNHGGILFMAAVADPSAK